MFDQLILEQKHSLTRSGTFGLVLTLLKPSHAFSIRSLIFGFALLAVEDYSSDYQHNPTRQLIKTLVSDSIISLMMGQAQAKSFENAGPAQPPAEEEGQNMSTRLALGAGCYWGTEKFIKKDFASKFPGSIKTVSVGFMAPETVDPRFKNPTYQQVCTGISGHIEVAHVELNEPEKYFEELLRFFFQFHDPTTKNRQGNDAGFQYASWIFCDDDRQKDIAKRVIEQLQEAVNGGAVRTYAQKKITTKVSPYTEFTMASDDHQEYLMKNPLGYCNHRIRFSTWPMKKKAIEKK